MTSVADPIDERDGVVVLLNMLKYATVTSIKRAYTHTFLIHRPQELHSLPTSL